MPEEHKLTGEHHKWLQRIGDAGMFLFEGDNRHGAHCFTITEGTASERAVLADLIRWGYAQWAGFLCGDLACKLTENGKALVA